MNSTLLPTVSTRTEAEPSPPKSSHYRAWTLGALVVLVLLGALTGGMLPRWRQTKEVNAAAAAVAADPPKVSVAIVSRAALDADRTLPGNSLPLFEAGIFARTTGYLKRRLVDIGDRVEEGQLLAEISAPDIDDQLAQAQANLAQARANLVRAQADNDFAKSEEIRYGRMVGTGAISREDYESKIQAAKVTAAAIVATEASIQVNAATVQRYTDLQDFQKIVALFPGVITARNVDAGDLIPADTPNTTKELFHLMRTDTLRVFVNVPQTFSTGIKVGQDAAVYRRDQPAKLFAGKVTRTADALDPNTRTLLTEVQVKNPDNALRPGMYLQVRFSFDRTLAPLVIPSAALATRDGPPRLAVLDAQNRVQYRTVDLGRDFGVEIWVIHGLKEAERVVVHPGDDLPEGTLVDPVTMPPPTGSGTAAQFKQQ